MQLLINLDWNLKMIKIFALLFMFSLKAFPATINCPISPNLVDLKINVNVHFDKKSQIYTYQYSFENSKTSRHTVSSIYLDVLENTDVIAPSKIPENWYTFKNGKGAIFPEFLHIRNRLVEDIKVGQRLSGFEIKSKLKPGPVTFGLMATLEGQITVVQTSDSEGEGPEFEEAQFICPGYFSKAYGIDSNFIKGITIGPVSADKVIAESRIKKITGKTYSGSYKTDPQFEVKSDETGKIRLMILGSKDLNVSKIDASSLRFGQGQAKPTKIETIGNVKEEELDDSDAKNHLKENKNVQHLLVEFDLKDVDVKCEIDRALFLKGTYNKIQELFSAVKLKHGLCEKKNWVKEEKFMRDYEKNRKD